MPRDGSLFSAPEGSNAEESGKPNKDRHDDEESMPVVGERNTAYVHAEKSGHEIDRQGENGDNGKHKKGPATLFVDKSGEFLLQYLDALSQRERVLYGGGELF